MGEIIFWVLVIAFVVVGLVGVVMNLSHDLKLLKKDMGILHTRVSTLEEDRDNDPEEGEECAPCNKFCPHCGKETLEFQGRSEPRLGKPTPELVWTCTECHADVTTYGDDD